MSEYHEVSKKRLLNNIKKKFDTTIIGSLAVFEEEFGELWGHGSHVSELTTEQAEYRHLWQEARQLKFESRTKRDSSIHAIVESLCDDL